MRPISLEYSERPRRRRRWLKRGSAVAVLLLAALASWRWGGTLRHKAGYAYGWRQCSRLDLPADLVVYEEDWTAAAGLLKSPDYHPPPYVLFDTPWCPHPPAGFVPPACYMPRPYAWLGLPVPYAIAFMHNRTTPKGVTRLISIDVEVAALAPDHKAYVCAWTYKWHASGKPGRDRSLYGGYGAGDDNCPIVVKGGSHVTVFAGRADPADASHFTLRYAIDGRQGTIDGWLRDRLEGVYEFTGRAKSEWVDFAVRDGPAFSAPSGQKTDSGTEKTLKR
jgi:hypothetical protein